jgi:hypothetical protein
MELQLIQIIAVAAFRSSYGTQNATNYWVDIVFES